jgi:hypothetical protein
MIQGDWWIFPDGKAAEMGGSEHAVIARREMLKLTPSDYMATWNIMKPLDDDELRLARSRGADEEALAFLMQSGPDPRWYAMKNWGWIRVHTNRKKGETYFQTLLFDPESLEVIRSSEFWKAQPQASDGDWVIVEELSSKKLFPMSAGKLRRGDPDEVLGRVARPVPTGLSYREIQQMYPSRENPPKFNAAFWRWFGASKLVDGKGNPLPMCHGTRHKFRAFDPAKIGKTDPGYYGWGFNFAPKKEFCLFFAEGSAEEDDAAASLEEPVLLSLYLKIERPFIILPDSENEKLFEMPEDYWRGDRGVQWSKNLTRQLVEAGYDGIMKYEKKGKSQRTMLEQVTVFYPAQIKSVDNDGSWDSNDPDIYSNPSEEFFHGTDAV